VPRAEDSSTTSGATIIRGKVLCAEEDKQSFATAIVQTNETAKSKPNQKKQHAISKNIKTTS
jgi:hypothetical protein